MALDYFGARYLHSATGRFTSVDPLVAADAALVDPQLWNRFAYVRNNPHRYSDPDGRQVVVLISPEMAERPARVQAAVSNTLDDLIGPHAAGLIGALVGGFFDPANIMPVAGSVAAPAGQLHHAVSKRIADAVGRHPNLAGRYASRDPRFTTRAIDRAAHRGYQTWHRKLDDEVSGWLDENPNASAEDFEKYLRGRYSQEDLLNRFPNGLGGQ